MISYLRKIFKDRYHLHPSSPCGCEVLIGSIFKVAVVGNGHKMAGYADVQLTASGTLGLVLLVPRL